MNTTKDTGGCAFPFSPDRKGWDNGFMPDTGMTLRDWFAGLAMLGMYANPTCREFSQKQITANAYQAANLMLEVRSETSGGGVDSDTQSVYPIVVDAIGGG